MALIIEDGTSKLNSNSYGNVDDLRTFASLRGIDLTAIDDAAVEVLLIKAMDYLEGKHDQFKGYKRKEEQSLCWPRDDVWDVEQPGQLTPNDMIPRRLVYAQFQLALDARDIDLQPTVDISANQEGAIRSVSVEGAVSIAYDAPVKQSYTPAFAKADAHLSPLLERSGLSLIRK